MNARAAQAQAHSYPGGPHPSFIQICILAVGWCLHGWLHAVAIKAEEYYCEMLELHMRRHTRPRTRGWATPTAPPQRAASRQLCRQLPPPSCTASWAGSKRPPSRGPCGRQLRSRCPVACLLVMVQDPGSR